MDIKKLAGIAILIFVIFAMSIAAFIRMTLKDGVLATVKQPVTTAEPLANYAIPSNTIPAYSEVEESIVKNEERRAELKRIHAEIGKERLKRQIARKAALKEQPPENAEENASAMPRDKNFVLPTIEERKEMASKGAISF